LIEEMKLVHPKKLKRWKQGYQGEMTTDYR
jgi:hypothetical protein